MARSVALGTWAVRMSTVASLGIAAAGLAAAPSPASAASRHHTIRVAGHAGISYDRRPQRGGSALVSDGPGTGYGFHRLPGPFRVGALIARQRASAALRSAVITDALTSGDFYEGYPGSSVYQYGPRAAYGVFTGGGSYGTPYFAGYYGPGDGADYGVFGHAYAN